MKGIKIISIMALIIAVVVLIFLLSKNEKASLFQGKKEVRPVKIGVVIPLSGKAASFGSQIKNGLEMGRESIENSDKKIKLIYEDEECEPEEASKVTYKLINLDQTRIIIGAFCSSSTLSIAPIAEANQIILITPGSAAEDISLAGDYVFRNHNRSSSVMTGFGNWAGQHYKKVVMFYDQSNEALVLAEKYFRLSFGQSGGSLESIPFISGGVSYKSEISKVKDWESVDAVLVESLTKSAITIIKELRELGIDKQLLLDNIVTQKDFMGAVGERIEGVIFVQPNYDKETNSEFWQEYRERYGEDPNVFAAQGYDTLMILSQIIFEKGCGEGTDCIRDELYRVKDYPGVAGLTTFDKNGDAIKEVVIKQVVGGKFVTIED